MKDDWSALVLATLIKRLGGSVTITREELIATDVESSICMEDDIMTGAIIFSLEDSSVVQGELV